MRTASFAATLFALAASIQGAIIPHRRATVCNGREELCARSYGNVTYLGAHDSFAFSKNPFALARDQEIDIPAQLKMGVRLLQAQAHVEDGELRFCHTSCSLFDGGLVKDYLDNVATFLRENPNEVITLIVTNPDNASLKDLWEPAFTASGVADFAFNPPALPIKNTEWPTLGQLIDDNKRVVVFMDSGADDRSVPFILPEFPMIWETPFSVTDENFPCSVDRSAGPLADEDHMYMINHSLNKEILPNVIISDPIHADETNSIDSILANAAGCAQFAAGRAPNFVLLDFVNLGQGVDAVNRLNGF